MLQFISGKFRLLRNNLTTLDDRPVSRTALTVVLLLDYFILFSIFQGLADHTSQMASPQERIPQHCRDIAIDAEWSEADSLVRIGRIVASYRNSYYQLHDKTVVEDQHPACQPISKTIRDIRDDKALSDSLSAYLQLRNHLGQARTEMERTRSAYDTSLLENIAGRDVETGSSDALQKQVTELMEKMNNLATDQAAAKNSLLQNEKIIQLLGVVESSQGRRDELLEELRSLNFWYPVKRLGMEMIFLLPLIVLFYLWNSTSTARNRPYQSLISSHLLVVVFIPVIFKLFELVYEIIPKQLLRDIFEFLESFNLVAIWHYVVIFSAIITALLAIYILQKKVFSHDKLMQKRIAKGLCQGCGEHLPAESKACPGCGFVQFQRCDRCQEETYVYGKFCRVCGAVKEN